MNGVCQNLCLPVHVALLSLRMLIDFLVIQVKCDGIVVCLFLRSISSSGGESDQNDQSLFVRGVPLYWPEVIDVDIGHHNLLFI